MRKYIKIVEGAFDDDRQQAIEDHDWKQALSDSSTPDQIKEILNLSGALCLELGDAKIPVWIIDDQIIEWDGVEQYPSTEDKEQWIYGVDLDKYFPDYEDRFNEEFWEYPNTLYHATTERNAETIEHEGLLVSNQSRGISNRGVGSAVFTTTEIQNAYAGHYGDVVFEINTELMKSDGYMPHVSQEPPVVEHEFQTCLAHQLGVEFEGEVESGIHEDTVILYGAIPPKYLTRLEK